jgi:hypothetical protein
MKTYDYKDEARDVKGKVSQLIFVTTLDRTTERDLGVAIDVAGLEECHYSRHS